MKSPTLSVVIPCFNEQDNLTFFSSQLLTPILQAEPQSEFIFVDDGSTDETKKGLLGLFSDYKNVAVISHPKNRGLGAALRSGFEQARGNWVLVIDADLTFSPAQYSKLKEAAVNDVSIVMGSPIRGEMVNVPTVRKFLSLGVNFIYRRLLGQPLTSTSSIFRLYRSDFIKSLTLRSNAFDINAEIIIKAVQANKKIVEIPVTLSDRRHGKSKINKIREIKNHFKLFLRLLWWRVFS